MTEDNKKKKQSESQELYQRYLKRPRTLASRINKATNLRVVSRLWSACLTGQHCASHRGIPGDQMHKKTRVNKQSSRSKPHMVHISYGTALCFPPGIPGDPMK